MATIIAFSLIQAWLPIKSKGGRDISLCVVDCSRIKWAWLRSLAVHDYSFVLKRGIKLVKLSFTAVYKDIYRSYIHVHVYRLFEVESA